MSARHPIPTDEAAQAQDLARRLQSEGIHADAVYTAQGRRGLRPDSPFVLLGPCTPAALSDALTRLDLLEERRTPSALGWTDIYIRGFAPPLFTNFDR